MAAVSPYLTFDGNCEEAFDFYQSVFGGQFYQKTRLHEITDDVILPDDEGQKIIYISLPVGRLTTLMGSDRPADMGDHVPGENFAVAISAGSRQEAHRLFYRLSAGGHVICPLKMVAGNAWFGMLADRFSVQWLIKFEGGEA
jgi:PhnB protein